MHLISAWAISKVQRRVDNGADTRDEYVLIPTSKGEVIHRRILVGGNLSMRD